MSFPNSFTNAVDGVTEIVAAHLNNLEHYIGIVGSTDPTSITYKLTNSDSIEPGHKHNTLWSSDGSNAVIIVDSSGRVGINTSNPSSTLHVVGTVKSQTIEPIEDNIYTCGSSSNYWSILYSRKVNITLTQTDISGTQNNLFIGNFNYTTSGTYNNRTVYVYHYINPGNNYSADNSGLDRAIQITAFLRSNAGTIKELSGIVLEYGAYGPGGADLIGTITNSYGIRINSYKVSSATITNNYGISVTGISGGTSYGLYLGAITGSTDAYGIYQSQAGIKNYLASSLLIGTTNIGEGLTRGIVLFRGTAPSTSPVDTVQLWSADRGGTAGKASLHIRTEDGTSHVFGDRVGIGTTSPSTLFHIAGGTNIELKYNAVTLDNQIVDNTTVSEGWPPTPINTYTATSYTALRLYNYGPSAEITSIQMVNRNTGDGTTLNCGVIGLLREGSGIGAFSFVLRNTSSVVEFRMSRRGLGIGTSTFGNGTNTITILNGTAPTTSPVDSVQLYSADVVAGNATLHIRTENGSVIKLYKESALTAQLTTITHAEPETPDYTIQDLTNSGGYGFVTKDEGNTVLKVIANLQDRLLELETRLKNIGIIA